MTRDTLFHMYKPFRESLIERHEFYVRQASSRLLSQFDNIEDDAIRAAENWLERASQHFDPDRDDPGAFYEQAGNEEIGFYTLLTEIHEQTRLSVVAGMFHEWDKQFREWVAREIKHWHDGEALVTQIWAQTPHGIAEFFASVGWDYRQTSYYEVIDACRLVVNVYKHGEGNSLEDLKSRFPRYLPNPLPVEFSFGAAHHINYQDLKVNDEDIRQFADAITAFWNDVPEYIFDDSISKLPEWFKKAWKKDGRTLDC